MGGTTLVALTGFVWVVLLGALGWSAVAHRSSHARADSEGRSLEFWPITVGILWGLTLPLNGSPTVGAVLTAGVMLTTASEVLSIRRARWAVGSVAALLLAGMVIALLNALRGFDPVRTQATGVIVAGITFGLLVYHLIWSSERLGWEKTAFVYYAATVGFIALGAFLGNGTPNDWKYTSLHMALPMLVAVVAGRRRLVAAVGFLLLAFVSVQAYSSRSVATALTLAALLSFPWTTRWLARFPRAVRLVIITLAAPLALAVGQWVLTSAARAGWLDPDLGAAVTMQSGLQLGLVGDRVGLFVGIALLAVMPLGLGIGIALDSDTSRAVMSLVPGQRGYDPFVADYMLGGVFNDVPSPHSGWGELLVWAGVLGLALVILSAALMVFLLDGVVTEKTLPETRSLVVIAVLLAGWQMFGGSVFTPALATLLWAWATPGFWHVTEAFKEQELDGIPRARLTGRG